MSDNRKEIYDEFRKWLTREYPNGISISAEKNHFLTAYEVMRIIQQKKPLEALEEKIYDLYELEYFEYRDDPVHRFCEEIDISESGIEWDDMTDIVESIVDFVYPIEQYLGEKFEVNIFINNENNKYLYSSKTCWEDWSYHKHVFEDKIVLTKQMSLKEIIDMVKTDKTVHIDKNTEIELLVTSDGMSSLQKAKLGIILDVSRSNIQDIRIAREDTM